MIGNIPAVCAIFRLDTVVLHVLLDVRLRHTVYVFKTVNYALGRKHGASGKGWIFARTVQPPAASVSEPYLLVL